MNDDVRFRGLFVGNVAIFLTYHTQLICRNVCKQWSRWILHPAAVRQSIVYHTCCHLVCCFHSMVTRWSGVWSPKRSMPWQGFFFTKKILSLCQRLIALQFPWDAKTEKYIRSALSTAGKILPVDREKQSFVRNAWLYLVYYISLHERSITTESLCMLCLKSYSVVLLLLPRLTLVPLTLEFRSLNF